MPRRHDDPDEHDAEPAHRRPHADDDHRWRHPLWLVIPVVVITLVAIAINRIEPAAPGPFYTPPDPLTAGDAGAIIRSEPLRGLPAGTQGWRVLYLSTDPEGKAIAVSGSVFAPVGPAPAGGRPVVAWAHPTTGVASRCAPSLEPDGRAKSVAGLAAFIAAGYVVTATDYPGLGTPGPHPYLVGESEGRAVIDSVRMADRLEGTGAGPRYALWGHSQGGHAALWAGQIAAEYGRGLQLVGVAAAAPATELAALFQRDIGGLSGNVLASMALVSWSEVFADQGLGMDQVVSPVSIPAARLIADHCILSNPQLLVDLPEAAILSLHFLSGDPWTTPGWDTTMADNTPGAQLIGVPVLVSQGTADTIVWPGVTADWVAARCRAGESVTLRPLEGVPHQGAGFAAAGETAAWLADRFAGKPVTGACAR
jgi:alpha-beta hydrolase superfamily lysophospholipase